MTPAECAKELKKKYLFMFYDKGAEFVLGANAGFIAKQCAIICVDEIISEIGHESITKYRRIDWWNEVKEEIEKL